MSPPHKSTKGKQKGNSSHQAGGLLQTPQSAPPQRRTQTCVCLRLFMCVYMRVCVSAFRPVFIRTDCGVCVQTRPEITEQIAQLACSPLCTHTHTRTHTHTYQDLVTHRTPATSTNRRQVKPLS